MKNLNFKAILVLSLCIVCFENGFGADKKESQHSPVDYKKYGFGYTFKGRGPTWSQDLCKTLDYNLLKPRGCNKANDNIGNKSIRCHLSDKKLKLAAYANIDECKSDLQMSTEGDNP